VYAPYKSNINQFTIIHPLLQNQTGFLPFSSGLGSMNYLIELSGLGNSKTLFGFEELVKRQQMGFA
jgi:hypothetical protein